MRNIETNSINGHTAASLLPSQDVSGNADRRAAAWLNARLMKGRKERFCEIVKMTPAIAAALLERNTHNRAVSQYGVAEYANAMMRGEWKLTAEGISVAKDGVLVNGQHRLLAVVESRCTVPITLWFGVERDEFRVSDAGRKRTAGHQATILGVPNPNVAAALATLLIRFETKEGQKYPSTFQITSYMEDMDQAELDAACRVGMSLKKIMPPTAGALAYWHIAHTSPNAHRLDEFLSGLALGESLTGPRLNLRNWLMEPEIRVERSWAGNVKKAAGLVHAWNAWLKGHKRVPQFAWKHVISLPAAL